MPHKNKRACLQIYDAGERERERERFHCQAIAVIVEASLSSIITDYSVTPSSLDPNSTNQGFR